MRWGSLLWRMRNERAPKAISVTLVSGNTWAHDRSAWVDDWLSRTWGARNLTAVIIGAKP